MGIVDDAVEILYDPNQMRCHIERLKLINGRLACFSPLESREVHERRVVHVSLLWRVARYTSGEAVRSRLRCGVKRL